MDDLLIASWLPNDCIMFALHVITHKTISLEIKGTVYFCAVGSSKLTRTPFPAYVVRGAMNALPSRYPYHCA